MCSIYVNQKNWKLIFSLCWDLALKLIKKQRVTIIKRELFVIGCEKMEHHRHFVKIKRFITLTFPTCHKKLQRPPDWSKKRWSRQSGIRRRIQIRVLHESKLWVFNKQFLMVFPFMTLYFLGIYPLGTTRN